MREDFFRNLHKRIGFELKDVCVLSDVVCSYWHKSAILGEKWYEIPFNLENLCCPWPNLIRPGNNSHINKMTCAIYVAQECSALSRFDNKFYNSFFWFSLTKPQTRRSPSIGQDNNNTSCDLNLPCIQKHERYNTDTLHICHLERRFVD